MITILSSLLLIAITSGQTIFEYVCNINPDTATLCQFIELAGLESALNDSASSITLFAPTNQALANLPPEILNQLLGDPSLLNEFLLYHGLAPERSAFTFDNGEQLIMLSTGITTIDLTGFFTEVIDELGGRANITSEDIAATNGFVNIIDAALLPTSLNITTTAAPVTTTGLTTTAINTTTIANITTTPFVNITTTAEMNMTTTDVNITTTAAEITTTAELTTTSPITTGISLPEENRERIEELEIRVTALERQIKECKCKKNNGGNNKGSKGSSKGRKGSIFGRKSSRRLSRFSSYRHW